ncbi:MFS transporter [Sphingomonas bisphenolicum]|uniref:MFS transporter n=1 Tax=Sphingomonas bisphenolicum TaxID=296544 RepID=A0ABM7G3M3_9SPHN|nr:MFS transporter [Sphingomonas bisphenolicum]BBF69978.1 MFS transporter [Sphingomonas bisphenolicum]
MTGRASLAEWRRNWHLVLLTVIGITCVPTTLPVYTIGLFVAPLQADFGWSRGAIQGAILCSTGLGLAGGPFAGWLVRRIGLKRAILSGLIGMGCALALAAAIHGSLWQLYLAYALIALIGAGTSAVTWSCLIAERFSASRGLALGIALSGSGLSAVLMPRLVMLGMAWGGWRTAYLLLAGFALLVILPLCALMLPRTGKYAADETATSSSGRSGLPLAAVLRDRRFWLIGASTAAIYLAVGGIIPNLVPALGDRGLPLAQAVTIMGILGGAIIAGRILVGLMIDHVWAPLIATIILLPAAGACLLLISHAGFIAYAVAAALLGAATGMEFDMLGFLVARYFGLADFARIYGRLYMFVAAAAGTAPWAYGALYDHLHNYDIAFILSALLLAGGAAGLLALGRYPVDPTDFKAV